MPLSHFVTAYPSPSPYAQVHSLVGLCLYSRLTLKFFMSFFFLRFHIYMCIPYICVYGICFSLSDFLHSVGFFQITVSALVLEACEILHVHFKCFLQLSCSLVNKPHWATKPEILRAHLPMQYPGLRNFIWGSDTFLLLEKLCSCDYPLIYGLLSRGCGS